MQVAAVLLQDAGSDQVLHYRANFVGDEVQVDRQAAGACDQYVEAALVAVLPSPTLNAFRLRGSQQAAWN